MRTCTEKAKRERQMCFIMHAVNLQIQINLLFNVKRKQITSGKTQ